LHFPCHSERSEESILREWIPRYARNDTVFHFNSSLIKGAGGCIAEG